MEYKRIIYEPGRVTRIKLNRPQYMNALSILANKELDDALGRAAADEECRVIVISGEGRCFSAGDDAVPSSPDFLCALDGRTHEQLVKQYGSEEAATAYWMKEHIDYGHIIMRKWRNIPQPTIAMVHSYCIFAGFLTAACMDLIFASEDALFLPPPEAQPNIGPWDIRPRKILELQFEHRFMTAREAYECGFVSRIYPDREILEKETLAYANRVADNNLITYIRNVKRGAHETMDIMGYTASKNAQDELRRLNPIPEAENEAMKVEKGIARVPRALANLKAKQEAEKKYYPKK